MVFLASTHQPLPCFIIGYKLKRGDQWFNSHIGSDELFALVADFTKLPVDVVRQMKFQPVLEKIELGELEKTMVLMKRDGLLKKDVDAAAMIYTPQKQ